MDQINQMVSKLPEWAQETLTAAMVLLIGWIIAIIARATVSGAINKTGLGKKAKSTGGNIGKSIGKAVYWIVLLFTMITALGYIKKLSGPDGPLYSLNLMMNDIMSYGESAFFAILTLGLGSVFAKVGKEATTSSLEALQADSFATKMGLRQEESRKSVANTVGNIVFGLLLFIFAASAIKILGIPALGELVDKIIDFLPRILVAIVILGISVWIGKFVSNLLREALPALGVDRSLKAISALDGETSAVVPSKIIATIVFAIIVLFGAVGATTAIGIAEWIDIADDLLELIGKVSLGAVIIAIGLFIANFISKIVTETSGDLAGRIIKYLTIILVTFMGLSQMELGNEIVNMAFENFVRAAAVAFGIGGAVAFGLGGREWAAKKLEIWWPSKTTRKK